MDNLCTVCEESPEIIHFFICGHMICQKCHDEYKQYNITTCLVKDCDQMIVCAIDRPIEHKLDPKKEIMLKFYEKMRNDDQREDKIRKYKLELEACDNSITQECLKMDIIFNRVVEVDPEMANHVERRKPELIRELNAQRKNIELIIQNAELDCRQINSLCNLVITMLNTGDYTHLDAAYPQLIRYMDFKLEFVEMKFLKFIILPDDADETIGNVVEDIKQAKIEFVYRCFNLPTDYDKDELLNYIDKYIDKIILISSIGDVIYLNKYDEESSLATIMMTGRKGIKLSIKKEKRNMVIGHNVKSSSIIKIIDNVEYIIRDVIIDGNTYIKIFKSIKLIKQIKYIYDKTSTDIINFPDSWNDPKLFIDIINDPESESKTYKLDICR